MQLYGTNTSGVFVFSHNSNAKKKKTGNTAEQRRKKGCITNPGGNRRDGEQKSTLEPQFIITVALYGLNVSMLLNHKLFG